MNNIVLETNLSWDQIDENVSKLNYSDSLDDSLCWAEQEMKKLKIARNKITSSNSVDKRLSFTSTKYKGYRISLDHKNSCYNIYDKHGDLEDSGFTSQLAAKEAIDKLVKESGVNASTSQEINLPAYAVQWVSGYSGNGVNTTEREYFRTPEERNKFIKKLESQNVTEIKTWTFENFYHTLPDDVKSSKKITASKGYEKEVFYPNGKPVSNVDMSTYLDYNFGEDRDRNPDHYTTEEKQRSVNYWFKKHESYVGSAEEIEYLNNKHTLREFIDELVADGVDIYDDQDILQALGADYGYDRDNQFAILEDIRKYVGQGINSSEEIDDDELETTEQEFTSKDTSINSSKLPAIYKFVNFPKGSVVLDFGGGKFDNGVEYLQSLGCEGYVYDPYNRTAEHNAEVVKAIRSNGGADIVLNSNVLNVIKEAAARRTVLKNIKKLVKPNGKVYITVYEGTSKNRNKPGPTSKGYQLNQLTRDYLDEIREVFPDADLQKGNGKMIVATPNGAPVKSSIQASEDLVTVGIYGDEVPGFAIVDQIVSYFRSKGIKVSDVSGGFDYGWEMNLTGEPRQLFLAVCNKIPGYNSNSVDEFIDEYRIDDVISGCNSINASQDTLSSRIFDFLDECSGYTDYNQKIEDVSEEFGMSPDEAEGYVSSWAQGMDAMWHDTADQYEDRDIEESCKVEASYRTRHKNYCPHCTNRTLMEVENGYYICDECGAEYKGEPSFEGGLILEDIEESTKIESSLAPFRARELVKELQDELYNKASEVMQRPDFGFPLEEIADYLVVEVEYQPEVRTQTARDDHPARIRCEVRAELSFDALMELADELNPIVEKYSKWAYFDAVTSGIIESYILLDEVYSSVFTSKQPIKAGYLEPDEYPEPEELERSYELVFDATAIVTEDSFEIVDDGQTFNEIYDYDDNISIEDDPGTIIENLQELIEVNMPYEPGTYRISGIAHFTYYIRNLYREYEGPSDPDDAMGTSWLNSEDADIDYDPRSSYVESFQIEKI